MQQIYIIQIRYSLLLKIHIQVIKNVQLFLYCLLYLCNCLDMHRVQHIHGRCSKYCVLQIQCAADTVVVDKVCTVKQISCVANVICSRYGMKQTQCVFNTVCSRCNVLQIQCVGDIVCSKYSVYCKTDKMKQIQSVADIVCTRFSVQQIQCVADKMCYRYSVQEIQCVADIVFTVKQIKCRRYSVQQIQCLFTVKQIKCCRCNVQQIQCVAIKVADIYCEKDKASVADILCIGVADIKKFTRKLTQYFQFYKS